MISQSDLIMIILAFLIGYVDDAVGPKEYYHEGEVVVVYEKYQCPSYCGVKHAHYVSKDQFPEGSLVRVPKKERKLK